MATPLKTKEAIEEITSGGIGIILGIVVLLIILLVLNYFTIINFSQTLPFLSFLPHRSSLDSQPNTQNTPFTGKGAIVNICTQQQTGFPPIQDILTTQSLTSTGQYYGHIQNIHLRDQSFTFVSSSNTSFSTIISSIKTTVYDLHHIHLTVLTDTLPGTKAVLTFPCLQQSDSFTISYVQMIQ